MYETKMWCGPNDGGIKRGDSAETGDLEARPTDGVTREGSGTGTADASSLGADAGLSSGASYITEDMIENPDEELTSGANIDDLTVYDAEDGTLGLTNIGNKPPEDWAADTGPTRTGEESDRGTGRR